MKKLFSRTSVTVDEAVAILLGWAKGPIEYQVVSEEPSPEELATLDAVTFCLEESLQDELDKLESDLIEAQTDNMPATIITEKKAAIDAYDEVIELAKAYVCAIHDEINTARKDQGGVLRYPSPGSACAGQRHRQDAADVFSAPQTKRQDRL